MQLILISKWNIFEAYHVVGISEGLNYQKTLGKHDFKIFSKSQC